MLRRLALPLLGQSNPLALPGASNNPVSWSSYQETLSSVYDQHVTGYDPQAKKQQQLAARKKECLDWPVRRLVHRHKPKGKQTF